MIGNRLKQTRITRGLTQQDLAERSNIALRNLTRYENDASDPGGDVLLQLARALETSVDYLVGLTDDPTPPHKPEGLNDREQRIIEALRRGETIEAIKLIVDGARVG